MSKDEIREFWDKKRIIPNNWIELCAFLLKEEFSDDFTVPLLQTDNSFMLQVRIIAMFNKARNMPYWVTLFLSDWR